MAATEYFMNVETGEILDDNSITYGQFKTNKWKKVEQVVRFEMFAPPNTNSVRPVINMDRGAWVLWDDVAPLLQKLKDLEEIERRKPTFNKG